MFNALKTMIFGGKPAKERRRLAAAKKPPLKDSYIVKQQIAIKVTEKMRPDLWDWFVLMGWREVNLETNRRKVRRLHDGTFAKLAEAKPAEREVIYRDLFNK